MAEEWIESGVPKWVTLVDELLFVLASAAFIRGSYDFFPGMPFERYVEGCDLFVGGSSVYLALSCFAAFEIIEDARISKTPAIPAKLIEQALYLLGSIFFLLGTVLFTPPAQAVRTASEVGAELVYSVFGRTYYISGGAAPEPPEASLVTGDELFVIGSILFSIAAFVSALTASGESGSDALSILRRRTSVAVASLFELGGVAFIVGTLGFYPAGPLGMATCPEGTTKLETGGALLFVAGSIAYTLGSMMILAFEVWNTYKYERETGKPTSPAEWAADSSTFLSTLEDRGEEEE